MRFSFLLSILLSWGIAANCHAGQPIHFVTEHIPPLQIEEPGQPLRGFAIELVEHVKRYAGISAQTKVYPWSRAYNMALNDPNTFIFSISRTKARENLFKWVGTFILETTTVYCLASRTDIAIDSVDDIKKYKISTRRNYASTSILQEHGFKTGANLDVVGTHRQALLMLMAGRVDLFAESDVLFNTVVQEEKYDRTKFKKIFCIATAPLCIAASKKTPDALIIKIRTALDRVKSDGTHRRLLTKWFGKHFSEGDSL